MPERLSQNKTRQQKLLCVLACCISNVLGFIYGQFRVNDNPGVNARQRVVKRTPGKLKSKMKIFSQLCKVQKYFVQNSQNFDLARFKCMSRKISRDDICQNKLQMSP